MSYTVEQLRAMPVLRSGPTHDLVIEADRVRVWVRRDNTPPVIRVEAHEGGVWERIGSFTDQLSPACQWLVQR